MDPFSFRDPFSYAEFVKTQGNQDFKNGNYTLAIKKYDEAINVLVYLHQTARVSHHRDMAVLLCNRSNAFYNLNKWEEAYYSAHESLQWDPGYIKGYYRAGYSLIKLSQPLDAAKIFHRGLAFLCNSSDVGQTSDFIVGVFSSINNERTITPPFLSICKKIVSDNYSPPVWQQVIEKLARKGLWQSSLLLAAEKDRLPRSLRVTNLSLRELFEKYVLFGQYEKMERVPKLVEWLLSIGANIESVGTYPLHAVIMLCMKAKGNHLFRWLLDHKPELKSLINQQNEDGSTVLHVVASQSSGYSLKNQIDDVVMLLNAGVDPRICDAQSRSAMDILKKNKKFRVIDIINKHMDRCKLHTEESPGQTESKAAADAVALLQDAFEQFVGFCCSEKRMHNISLLKHEKIQRLLQLLSTIREIPEEIVCDIPSTFASSFIKLLLEKQMWHEVLLLLTRRATGKKTSGDGLVKNCSLSDLDIGTVLKRIGRSDERRVKLISCLIESGAPPEGTGTIHEKPLQKCLKNNDFELAYLLLSSGADPCHISIVEGDTPLHAALSICFDKKDDIGLRILSYLLELFYSNPSMFPHLNPNNQDKNGNTVMHIIFQKNLTKHIKKMLGLLAKFDINFNLKNNFGRDVRYRKKKNDPMLIAWNEALGENKKKYRHDGMGQQTKMLKSTSACNRSQAYKNLAHSSTAHLSKMPPGKLTPDMEPLACAVSDNKEEAEDVGVKNPTFRDTNKPLTLRECLVQEITQLIQKLALGEISTKINSVSSQVPKQPFSVAGIESEESEHQQMGIHEGLAYNGRKDPCLDKKDLEEKAQDELNEAKAEKEEATEADRQFQEIETYIQDFDNMTWEIECTSEMLKKLGNKSIPHYMKKKVIFVIQQLGNGEWTQGLQKRLKHLKADIQLYEAKLDKGARMLWELAIDFSPRCSENAEKIIENKLSTHPTEKTGRVYTEIIRIWDIVLDHCKLDRAIDRAVERAVYHAAEKICKAYNRGLSCILRKKLKGINATLVSSNLSTQKRIPRIYVEDTKAEKSKDHVLPEYFPPASAVETEYNIMKFHSFSTNMALNIINDMTSAVEYPFRVGELEYAVIDLNPKPLEPIILIGRSGTGKTTCCLYRLWKKFYSYWEKAELADGPLLVRQTWHRLKFNMHLEDKNTEEEDSEKQDGSDPTDSSELETSLSTDNEQEQDEAEQGSSLGDPEMNLLYDHDEECTEEESDKLEHLHQIFVTKNHVLRQEVQRNFIELSKSSKPTSHFKPLEANVYRLQDVKDENFPLFLTSRQLLLLLDASVPEPFFLRNEDGSLKRTIAGWSTKDDHVISNWQEEDEEVDVEVDYDEDEKAAEVHVRECDPRVFVTYSIFANEIWPKMVKGKCPYNPALVWKEIKSFLKGSFEALSSHQGILTEEEYKKLGRKRSPDFKEDRSEIYQLFCLYQQIKSQGNYFDEEDVLHKLCQRLSKLSELPWCIHELYGDEIQDFTQAELALLMKCIDDPNAMFLTGDTAQSIMKGVAFRFSDLKSLFHYASKNSADKKQCIVRKPKRIYQLYQNYRSHSGILYLASGVVDLLQYYFPESFDRLPRDSGLFDGPKPTVLNSCSVSDLAILLRGNKRKTQPIEFGAHQVILVANDTAKENIPEELSLALVLTIYEAKGLEFDDVLLYNFFTDSEAYKEWKIISSFTPASYLPEETKLITELPLEKDADAQGKLPVVNLEMYKMLNGELKQLYTAVTRARVNLWIFDENSDRRAPAFEYFIKRELVQVVKTEENKDFDDSMFVKTSTPEEWIAQGEYYAKHQCWKVAAKCYQKGGEVEKEKLALAHDAVLKVQSKKISLKEKQMEYMNLAKTYLECGEPNLAVKCLIHAKEYQLCAQLYEKLGKVKEAAYFYKRGQCYKDAYRCFEQIQEFDLALKMCCHEELYEEAAKSVERYEKILRKERRLTSKLSYTANQFYLEAAAKYLRTNNFSEMTEALSHLDTEDQLVFLKTHKCFAEAADLLKREHRDEEAAKLMKQHGFVLEAAKLTNQKEFRASCLLAAARLNIAGICKLENIKAILNEALDLCEQTNQKSGSAEAIYLMGLLEKDFYTMKKAFDMFLYLNHNAGAVEALFGAIHCEEKSEAILRLTSYGIEALLKLVKAFQKAGTNAEKEMVKSCFEYFGIVLIDGKNCQVSQNEAGCILAFLSENYNPGEKKTSDQFIVSLEDVKSALHKHLLNRLTVIIHRLLELSFPNICMKFIAGLNCEAEACEDFHRVLTRYEIKSIFQCKMHLAAINGLLLEAKQVFPKNLLHEPNLIDELLTADKYALSKSLINAIFPKHFHLRMVSANPVACKQILSLYSYAYKSSNLCGMVLRECVRSEFKNETTQNRRESTDLLLKMMQVFALTSSYPEEFEKLLFREEDEYNRELKMVEETGRGRLKGVEGRYGMLLPDKYTGNAESTHLCFIRLLQDSMDQLYVHRNLEQCKWLFYRFMNVLVKKCIDPLIPSIGNTMTLLEFQFILCCAVLMRLCKNMTLCLPKSYIAVIHFWDFLFTKGDRCKDMFTFSVIQEYKPQDTKQAIKEFKAHLRYLADVLCGYEHFNVLLDAFRDLDYIMSGEAERTVVLCLVMLVNADQVLSWKYTNILAEQFPTLRKILIELKNECPSKVPERLLKIVDLMSGASSVKEVVEGLKELLFCRDAEFLADCCWRWDPKGARSTKYEDNKGMRGIYYEVADLDRFAYVSQTKYFEEPELDLEEDIYVDEREDPLANIASIRQQKQQQKASAKRKLRCLFLFVYCCIRWKRISCSKQETLDTALGIFKKADIDPTQCDLCGVKFLQRLANFTAQTEHSEKELTEVTTPTETDWEESMERSENFAAGETFENHIILDEHANKRASYQRYFEFFRNEVEPLIRKGLEVVESIGENMCIKGRFASNEQSSLMERKIQEAIKKISDKVEDIYKRKAWADAEKTMSKLASDLNSNLDKASNWLKETESCLLKEEEFDHDKDLDNEVKGEEEAFEELHRKKTLRKTGKRKKK
ncbi:TPR and ankyrin repeat-containing protein 1 isoform X2 [Rhineura floridana]|uniref:TPR and ankyrin repeat-containing protein 1 isoform X2 n=1 Tax=Rhineura floridana TaxID=261503 RepID=UPI002AC8031F|nr:TPR and ankyrin repeat-containing protein 1 isoform X2 [Rhineura floridana]